jgi:hypothetical protein
VLDAHLQERIALGCISNQGESRPYAEQLATHKMHLETRVNADSVSLPFTVLLAIHAHMAFARKHPKLYGAIVRSSFNHPDCSDSLPGYTRLNIFFPKDDPKRRLERDVSDASGRLKYFHACKAIVKI